MTTKREVWRNLKRACYITDTKINMKFNDLKKETMEKILNKLVNSMRIHQYILYSELMITV